MAPIALKKVSDNWWATGNAAITDSAVSLVLSSSGAAGLTVPCVIHDGAEKILVTAIAEDTPSAGLDTLTIERGFGSTTAIAHLINATYQQWYYKEIPNTVSTQMESIKMILAVMLGRSNGIPRSSGSLELKVTAQGTPDMTVNVDTGAALIDEEVAGIIADATVTFTAPVTNPRIDVIEINQDGTVSAVTGTEAASPSAPSVSSGAIKLAEVTHTTAETSIKDTDDATNGYITDSRVFI
jgi:hypothetical protein